MLSLSASLAVMLLYTYPGLVALGAWLLFDEHPGRRKLISLAPVSVGLVMLAAHGLGVRDPRGFVFGLGSAVLYAVYILASARLLRGIDSFAAVAWIQTAAGMVLAALHLHDGARVTTLLTEHWLLIVGTAVLCTLGPMALFLSSLRRIPAAEVSLLSTAEPITAVVAAAVVLGERLSGLQIAGAAAVVAGLIYMAWPERASSPAT
jgi:drug/metabolite transporter (DMT)-like permease